jgi:hypothetical protein
MYIDVIIPYEPSKQLGFAYNRSAASSKADWLLFIDYDVFLLNQRFYDICLSAISSVPDSAGWITARTNRLGPMTRIHQLLPEAPSSDDLGIQNNYSETLYKEYGNSVIDITPVARKVPLSGFFILTPRAVACSVGFKNGMLGVDNWYCKDLLSNGYSIWMLPGLYCYHRYGREWRV